MNKDIIYKEIHSYPDFLTDHEYEYLYKHATNPKGVWNRYEFDMSEKARVSGYVTKEEQDKYFKDIEVKNPYWSNKMLGIDNDILSKSIENRMYKIYNPSLYRINYPGIIQKQYVNDEELKLHYDQGHDKSLLKAIVVYINDDYVGGELYFPEYDIEIKPKAKTLITFPATDDYLHGTRKVTSGSDRFVIATFVFRK